MNIKQLILKELAKKGKIKVADVVKLTGFSRVYIHRHFRELRNDGKIALVGRSNQAHYILHNSEILDTKKPVRVHRMLRNKGLTEDTVLDQIKSESMIFSGLPSNIDSITAYAFTEMLNNAIEHSQTDLVDIVFERTGERVWFDISDKGIQECHSESQWQLFTDKI